MMEAMEHGKYNVQSGAITARSNNQTKTNQEVEMLRNKTVASIPVLLSSQGMRMICISNFVWKLGIIFYADNLFIWTASITILSRVFDAIDLK